MERLRYTLVADGISDRALLPIRSAAGNPNGRQAVELPRLSVVESLPDPKKVLHDLLRKASGLPPRRLRRFPAASRAQQVGSHVDDFTPLLKLSAFRHLDSDLRDTVASNNVKT